MQSLLSVLWEVDAWRKKFAALSAGQLDAADVRADALACLGFMKENLAAVLRDHKIEILDGADASKPSGVHARPA